MFLSLVGGLEEPDIDDLKTTELEAQDFENGNCFLKTIKAALNEF